jgi:ABC-2 type transport system permease protein
LKKKLLLLLLLIATASASLIFAADFDGWRPVNVNWIDFVLYTFLPFFMIWALVETVVDRRAFVRDVKALGRYRFFLVDLVARDIKTKYRRSTLGVFWSVLNPLMMMCVLTAVFSFALRVQVDVRGGYPLFYLTGYIIFNFVSESTNFSLVSLLNSAGLIKKVFIPRYIFPLEKCCYAFVNMCLTLLAFVIVFVVFLITGRITPDANMWTMALAIVPMIYVFIFAFGLGLLLSAAAIFFRDVLHLWSVFLSVWMYASPIIYPLEAVPAWLRELLKLNPLTHYINYFRAVLIEGRVPGLTENLTCIVFSLAAFAVGLIAFRKRQDRFILYI